MAKKETEYERGWRAEVPRVFYRCPKPGVLKRNIHGQGRAKQYQGEDPMKEMFFVQDRKPCRCRMILLDPPGAHLFSERFDPRCARNTTDHLRILAIHPLTPSASSLNSVSHPAQTCQKI
jgi:hypothetical protein